jgi:hypothetical protein
MLFIEPNSTIIHQTGFKPKLTIPISGGILLKESEECRSNSFAAGRSKHPLQLGYPLRHGAIGTAADRRSVTIIRDDEPSTLNSDIRRIE